MTLCILSQVDIQRRWQLQLSGFDSTFSCASDLVFSNAPEVMHRIRLSLIDLWKKLVVNKWKSHRKDSALQNLEVFQIGKCVIRDARYLVILEKSVQIKDVNGRI